MVRTEIVRESRWNRVQAAPSLLNCIRPHAYAIIGNMPNYTDDQSYGCREFAIQGLDGYDIAFGQRQTPSMNSR